VLVLLAVLGPGMGEARADPTPLTETTVGMSGRLEAVVLPGPELEAMPLTDHKAAVVLRIVQVYPHGSAFRYDLEFYALEPGTHDLRSALRRKDGKPVGDLPPLPVKVAPLLAPGQVEPNRLIIEPAPRVGGYHYFVIGFCVFWGLVLAAIIVSFVFPRARRVAATRARRASVAERLRPLVEGAIAGQLSQEQLAGLERGLLAYWRKRLGVETAGPGEAVELLRHHPEAGPLLNQLEAWLHKPGPPGPVDVPALLAPYRDLPTEAVDLTGATAGKAVPL
jgi:hypothetical protein